MSPNFFCCLAMGVNSWFWRLVRYPGDASESAASSFAGVHPVRFTLGNKTVSAGFPSGKDSRQSVP
jgi:hypothetical protein